MKTKHSQRLSLQVFGLQLNEVAIETLELAHEGLSVVE
jgi:hypothetical protein